MFGYDTGSAKDNASVSVSADYDKLGLLHFATLLSTSSGKSFRVGKSFMYMYSVFIISTTSAHKFFYQRQYTRKWISVLESIFQISFIFRKYFCNVAEILGEAIASVASMVVIRP